MSETTREDETASADERAEPPVDSGNHGRTSTRVASPVGDVARNGAGAARNHDQSLDAEPDPAPSESCEVLVAIPAYNEASTIGDLSMGVVRADSRVSDTQSGFRAYDRAAIA